MNLKEVERRGKLALSLLVSYPLSAYTGELEKRYFANTRTYCMFMGYPRSGHSLVSALIDAHPNAIISHELDVLLYSKLGFGKKQICSMILANSRNGAEVERRQPYYSYGVPNQWQGRFTELKVIGDKYGDVSTRRIQETPGIVKSLEKKLGMDVKIIHVIRNPYDVISTWAKRKNTEKFENIIHQYFKLANGNKGIKKEMKDSVLDIKHEFLIKNPKGELKRVCDFLGLDDVDGYLSDCAKIIYDKPNKSRKSANWTPELINEVAVQMERCPFLEGYTYEN